MGHRKIPCSYGVPSNVLRAVSSSLMRCLCGLAFRRKISASSVMVKFFRIQLRAWSLVVLSSPPPTCLTVLVQQRGRSVAAADGEGRAIFEESEVSLAAPSPRLMERGVPSSKRVKSRFSRRTHGKLYRASVAVVENLAIAARKGRPT
eukprot:Polyplicarium_translucidae@DN810_c0_g1_i1.p1